MLTAFAEPGLPNFKRWKILECKKAWLASFVTAMGGAQTGEFDMPDGATPATTTTLHERMRMAQLARRRVRSVTFVYPRQSSLTAFLGTHLRLGHVFLLLSH